MSKPENPPAFPTGNQQECEPGIGMTLRDWFAGQMLCASVLGDRPEWMAEYCYRMADAMLAERAKG